MARGSDNTVRAVEHSLALLERLYHDDSGGVSELADDLDMAKSTIHNHLRTLERLGFVVRESGRYRLGYRFLTFGGKLRDANTLYQIAKPHVDDLAAETGELAAITMEEMGHNLYLYLEQGPKAVSTDIHLGTRLPLHCLASGKAILAALPPERVEEILPASGLPSRTPNTITDRAELIEDLERIRDRGYAFDDEERIQGMRAVGVAIEHEDDANVLGAIVVSGSTNRVHGDYFREELPRLLARRAREIEINVTYS